MKPLINTGAAWEINTTCNDHLSLLICSHFEEVFRNWMVDRKQKPESPRYTDDYVYEALELLHYHSQGRNTGIMLEDDTVMRLAVLAIEILKETDRFRDNYNEQRAINNLHKQLHRKWATKKDRKYGKD